jgi:hypothetical protein
MFPILPDFTAGADIAFQANATSAGINNIKSPIENWIDAVKDTEVLTATNASPANPVANKNPLIWSDRTGGNTVTNLPSAAAHNRGPIRIKNIDATFNTTTINANGSDTIVNPFAQATSSADTSFTMHLPGETYDFYPNGTTWIVTPIQESKQMCRFKTRLASNQTLGAGFNLVNFDTELFDIGSNYNTTTKRFVAPFDGLYSFSCTIPMSAASVDTTGIFDKNGTPASANRFFNLTGRTNVNTPVDLGVTTTEALDAGDYVDVFMAGSGRTIIAGEARFEGHLVSRL